MTQREILVTHALPYANGPLHIGHLLGYIQSDIWVRARRMSGDTVHFVAADDVHGTPIMLAAEKAGMAPEEFIKGVQVSLRSSTDTIELIVADAGEPIAEAERTRLFEPFYRRGNTDGHGLGLALVRQIARRHGGDAQYDAIAADRAGFIVTLPHSRSASSQQ